MRDSQISFAQGLQLFFIEKILTDKHAMGTEARSKRGIAFFTRWSQIVCDGRTRNAEVPFTVRLPRFLSPSRESQSEMRDIKKSSADDGASQKTPMPLDLSFLDAACREAYRPLIEDRRFIPLFHLLADADLGRLMQIEYPSGAATKVAATLGGGKDADIIKEAVARALNKSLANVTETDYAEVTELDLSQSEIEDLTPVAKLTNLRSLDLAGTKVSDVTALANLINLQRLDLAATRVADVTVLGNLTDLKWLRLWNTDVSDVTALGKLNNLQWLFLANTTVSDVTALANLTNLHGLDLQNTPVGEVQMTALQKAIPNVEILR